MEFFAIASVPARVSDLQRHVRIATLPRLCASVDKVMSHEGERGQIYCVWGEFTIHREMVRDGVRFSLPSCRNGVQWTVTTGSAADSGKVVIHCTVNQRQVDPDFVESLEQFAADWKAGLEGELASLRAESAPKAGVQSMPWFG